MKHSIQQILPTGYCLGGLQCWRCGFMDTSNYYAKTQETIQSPKSNVQNKAARDYTKTWNTHNAKTWKTKQTPATQKKQTAPKYWTRLATVINNRSPTLSLIWFIINVINHIFSDPGPIALHGVLPLQHVSGTLHPSLLLPVGGADVRMRGCG